MGLPWALWDSLAPGPLTSTQLIPHHLRHQQAPQVPFLPGTSPKSLHPQLDTRGQQLPQSKDFQTQLGRGPSASSSPGPLPQLLGGVSRATGIGHLGQPRMTGVPPEGDLGRWKGKERSGNH